MINKEEFIDLVNSSISFTAQGVPYLIIEDKLMACPFCHSQLHMNKNLIECFCDESKKFAEEYLENKKTIKKLELENSQMESSLKIRSLSFFKKYFRDVIEPQMKQEYNRQIENILSL